MSDVRPLLERGVGGATPPPDGFERMLQRRDRKRRNQRITAGVIGIAVFVAAIWIVTTGVPFDRTSTPATHGPTGPAERSTAPTISPPIATAPWYSPDARSEVDYVIDLRTGDTTPLPEAVAGSLGENEPDKGFHPLDRYGASPDGSMLAFVGLGQEGTPQVFTAGIDGTGVHQVTHDPTRATSPAWSPDGTLIAYEGYGNGDVANVFVLDVATEEVTQITDERGDDAWDPTFTPDGRSLLYSAGSAQVYELRVAPVDGGESRLLIGAGEGIDDAGNGSMSPNGSLVSFLGGGTPTAGEVSHCGPCRLVSSADGTGRKVIDGWMATPAGMWSPDGSRIVTMDTARAYADLPDTWPTFILVVDVATEEATIVANGRAAIWLDDHTLLVAV